MAPDKTPPTCSATATPTTVPPGGKLTVKVVALDADNKAFTLSGHVQDLSGGQAPWSVMVNVSDPLTNIPDPPPAGWTVAVDPADPSGMTLIYTAPL